MGGASVPARLFPIHAARRRLLAREGRLRGVRYPAGGRIFPIDVPAAAKWLAVFSRPPVLRRGAVPGASRTGAALVRFARSRAELYTGIYMQCTKALLILWSVAAAWAADFSGSAALEFTRKAVAFGQRPPGSAANKRLQAYIETQLASLKCQK